MNSNKRREDKEVKDIITLIVILAICCLLSWYETHYTKEATVYLVQDDIVKVVDDSNNYWEFESEGFHEGDKVEMLMDTMHTLDIHDDEIQKVYIIRQEDTERGTVND